MNFNIYANQLTFLDNASMNNITKCAEEKATCGESICCFECGHRKCKWRCDDIDCHVEKWKERLK